MRMKKYLKFLNIFVAEPIGHSIDPMNLLEKYPPSLEFTADEEARGKSELKN